MLTSDRSIVTLATSAGAALFLFAATLILSDSAGAQSAFMIERQRADGQAPVGTPIPWEMPVLRVPSEPGDDTSTLEAIEIALTQAGDGATYIWRRGNGRLVGAVRPTSTFRDADRRICRHIEMQLRLGSYTRRTEGIACRSPDGVWDLEG